MGMHFGRLGRRMKKTAAIVMVAVVSFVAVARGEVLCFCDEDPDDCGHACHACGAHATDGISAMEDDCLHLDLSTDDLVFDDGRVQLPIVGAVPPAFPARIVQASFEPEVVPRATSPPGARSRYSSYSIRLFPRS